METFIDTLVHDDWVINKEKLKGADTYTFLVQHGHLKESISQMVHYMRSEISPYPETKLKSNT